MFPVSWQALWFVQKKFVDAKNFVVYTVRSIESINGRSQNFYGSTQRKKKREGKLRDAKRDLKKD